MCYLPNTVIIADDDADDSLFLVESLHTLNLELIIINVPNGQRLIDILNSISPSLIFLDIDINMPKKNGFEALKQIRSNRILNQPTVIMCSTSGSPDEITLSQELGANMYLKKPNDKRIMNKMIEDVFRIDWSDKEQKSIPKEFIMDYDKKYATKVSA